MLQQGLHAGAKVLLQDGLHGCSPPAQAEVEVSEPEDLVEAGGDVRWGMRGREVCGTRPLSPCVCSPTTGQDTPAHPRKWVAAQDPLGAQGQGGTGVGGCPQLFWVQGVTTRGAWCQTFLQVGERLQTFLALDLKALTIPLH